MLNQVVLVGRITKSVELIKKGDLEYTTLYIKIPRSFKNQNGKYDEDNIKIKAFGAIANNAAEYLKNGDIIGIKGRLQCYESEIQVIAEKLSFLSNNSTKESTK